MTPPTMQMDPLNHEDGPGCCHASCCPQLLHIMVAQVNGEALLTRAAQLAQMQ